jgi:carboxyl-terminal processing protease
MKHLPTLKAMLKRISLILAAVAAGFLLAQTAARHPGAPSWWPDRERDRNVRYFREVMQTVKEDYYDGSKADYHGLTRAALKGMVGQLDPHSEFLTADEFAETEEELTSEFSGVGIQVEQRDGHIIVVSTIAGTPAEEAGIRRGDQLVRVDSHALDNPTLEKTIKLIRGKPGTLVTLTMIRAPQSRELEFKLQRQLILMPSVRNASLRNDGIGYLQITQFSEPTSSEFASTLVRMEKQGLRALVIDLRNNPGGLLTSAIDVCNEFFDPNELVVYTQGRTPESRENFRADGKHPHRAYPIAVLVNGRDRLRRPAGHPAGGHRGRAHLWQGVGAKRDRAGRRRGDAAHHRPVLHAQRPRDSRARRPAPGGGGDFRRRRVEDPAPAVARRAQRRG